LKNEVAWVMERMPAGPGWMETRLKLEDVAGAAAMVETAAGE